MAGRPSTEQEITDNDKLMGLLSYVITLIVPLIVLLSEEGKARAFQRYHAIQSLGLLVVGVVYDAVVGLCLCVVLAVAVPLLGVATAPVGGIGACLPLCLLPVFLVPWFVAIYYGIKAYQGQYVRIPVLTDFMTNQGWL